MGIRIEEGMLVDGNNLSLMRETYYTEKCRHNGAYGIDLAAAKQKIIVKGSVKDFHFDLDHFSF